MAYQKHALVAIGGIWDFPNSAREVWQFGVRVSIHAAAGYWLEDPQGYANSVGPNIATWFAAGTNNMSSDAQLTVVKVNNITAAGHYADLTTHQWNPSAPVNGGSANKMPITCSLAYTWETGHTSGRARRGRVYPPNGTYTLVGGDSVSTTNRDAARASAKALLTILSINEPGGSHFLVFPEIVSKIDASINDINGVSVDDKYDIQRRRSNRVTRLRSSVLAFP